MRFMASRAPASLAMPELTKNVSQPASYGLIRFFTIGVSSGFYGRAAGTLR